MFINVVRKTICPPGYYQSVNSSMVTNALAHIDLSEPKYEYLIKKRKNAGIKHLNDPNAFIECSDG